MAQAPQATAQIIQSQVSSLLMWPPLQFAKAAAFLFFILAVTIPAEQNNEHNDYANGKWCRNVVVSVETHQHGKLLS